MSQQNEADRPFDDMALRVLLAEDNPIVTMDVEEELRAEGAEILGPFTTCRELAACIDAPAWRPPQVAVLDLHLRDGLCVEIARKLSQDGVRLVICSGSVDDWAEEFPDAVRLDKPYDVRRLVRLVTADLVRADGHSS